MSDKPPTLPPASEPFPGSRTPGWNDPPTLQYNPLTASNSGTGRPRLNLNKRVAFPLQGMGGPAESKPTAIVQPNQSGMPPPPPIMSLPPASSTSSNNNQPIAVVHPMPNINAATANAPRVPPTSMNADNRQAMSASSAADIATTTTTVTTESNVPSMFVPAMPRAETDIANRSLADTSGHSTVQHI